MDKTLKLIQKALRSDPEYKCSMTKALDILWDAYHTDGRDRMFDEMVSCLERIENTFAQKAEK